MTANVCPGCTKPTGGAKLCDRCTKTLAISLVNCSAYYADLDTIEAKAARYGSGAGSGQVGKEQPLPVDARFLAVKADGTQVKYDVWKSTVTWCKRIMLEAGNEITGPVCTDCIHRSCADIRRRRWPRNTVRSMLAYFDRQFRFITRADWVGTFLAEMLDNEARMRRLIDRPADRWYAGKCSVIDEDDNACEAELYAIAGNRTVVCPACGITHNVNERRDVLLTEAREVHVTATEAASALIAWTDYDGTETKLVDRISKWRDRDQLEVQDVISLNGRDRHLYRLGDIQQLLIAAAQKTQAKHSNGAA